MKNFASVFLFLLLTKRQYCDIILKLYDDTAIFAGVAELADALASGASVRKDVWVQVPPSAPSSVNKKDDKGSNDVDASFEPLALSNFFIS